MQLRSVLRRSPPKRYSPFQLLLDAVADGICAIGREGEEAALSSPCRNSIPDIAFRPAVSALCLQIALDRSAIPADNSAHGEVICRAAF